MSHKISGLRPSVFISSTFADFYEERKLISDYLNTVQCDVNAIDIQPASNTNVASRIKQGIENSDFIILLIGNRYGSILPKMTGSEEKSITHWEYELAIELNKPICVYFNPKSQFYDDIDIKKARLDNFKEDLESKHNPGYFYSKEELLNKLPSTMISMYREIAYDLSSKLSISEYNNRQLNDNNKRLENTNKKHQKQSIKDSTNLERLNDLEDKTLYKDDQNYALYMATKGFFN